MEKKINEMDKLKEELYFLLFENYNGNITVEEYIHEINKVVNDVFFSLINK